MYTVRPWVRNGVFKAGLPTLPITPKSSISNLNSDFASSILPSTIRLIESRSTPDSLKPPNMSRSESFPLSRDSQISAPRPTPTPTSSTPERHTPRAALFGPREREEDKASPKTPSTVRPRGNTIPTPTSRAQTPERDTDSVLSFTPSTSSKHIASWFSGLLGR